VRRTETNPSPNHRRSRPEGRLDDTYLCHMILLVVGCVAAAGEGDDALGPRRVNVSLISVTTPQGTYGLSAADGAAPADTVDWRAAAIPAAPDMRSWEFPGRRGEFLFRADAEHVAARFTFLPFSFRVCNVRRFKLEFWLGGSLVHKTKSFPLRARSPHGVEYEIPGAVRFRDVKLVGEGNADSICLPEVNLYVAPPVLEDL